MRIITTVPLQEQEQVRVSVHPVIVWVKGVAVERYLETRIRYSYRTYAGTPWGVPAK